MMVVEYDGRQIEMPMGVLLQMMGGDVAALQALMQDGNAGSDDDDSDDVDFYSVDSVRSYAVFDAYIVLLNDV